MPTPAIVAPIALALASHPDLESHDLSSLRFIMWGATPVTASVAETVTRAAASKDGVELDIEFPRVTRADLSGYLTGTATFEGLAEDVHLEGTIELAIFGANKLHYEFGFETSAGAHRCDVATAFSALRPISSLQRVEGTLRNERAEDAGDVVLNLELADRAVGLLTSFRLL